MRYRAWLAALLCLGGCGSHSNGAATLVLENKFWDRVNVQAVITKSSDCDNRGPEYLKTTDFEMGKNQLYNLDAPSGYGVCWRHDPDPNNPVKGAWSGWSRAVLYPGQEFRTDL